jgi:hypothetical protein
MLISIAKAAALAALLCPLATPLNVPSTELLRPRVPWKDTGLWDHKYFQKRQDGYPTSGGCNHGPAARGCWHGEFDIDTDMDESWPNTGKIVKVSHFIVAVSSALTWPVPSRHHQRDNVSGRVCEASHGRQRSNTWPSKHSTDR